MSTETLWNMNAKQLQQLFSEQWTKILAGTPSMGGGSNAASTALKFDAQKLQLLQQEYVQELTRLWGSGFKAEAPFRDKRFASEVWIKNPLSVLAVSSYLLNGKILLGMVDALQTDDKTRQRVRFAVEQWIAAAAPSNYLALNPEALQQAIETQGQSLAKGIQNLLHDVQQGHISMTDEHAFEVGKNLATTEGAVVFENEYFQLLEYKPLTAKVYERPLLLVPPCINKYYILDLQPDNSLIRYAISEGHRTFVVSWRNPDESLSHATWDDYIEHALLKAIEVTREIANTEQINTLGFCVGGTLLTCALAVLAARGQRSVASATLLTTLVDFADSGVLDVFIDEGMVRYREMQMGKKGLLKGQELASTFSFLRPNELVWNYVVGNYLKGQTPPAFDLLYWNSDATNLPGPWYAWYLRNMYLENNLVKPGQLSICGEPIDLGLLDVPLYIYGSKDDHIVPIQASYASTQVFKGKKRFVMGASGHIAGVINPPAKKKRSYWAGKENFLPADHSQWLAVAKEHAGSWWPDWMKWLQLHAGKQIAAPKRYGRAKQYMSLESAPGSYVKQKA